MVQFNKHFQLPFVSFVSIHAKIPRNQIQSSKKLYLFYNFFKKKLFFFFNFVDLKKFWKILKQYLFLELWSNPLLPLLPVPRTKSRFASSALAGHVARLTRFRCVGWLLSGPFHSRTMRIIRGWSRRYSILETPDGKRTDHRCNTFVNPISLLLPFLKLHLSYQYSIPMSRGQKHNINFNIC